MIDDDDAHLISRSRGLLLLLLHCKPGPPGIGAAWQASLPSAVAAAVVSATP